MKEKRGDGMAKYLIVNADDMGFCEAINCAIEELALAGRITSTSLMILGDSLTDALRRISKFKHLIGIGLHIALPPDKDVSTWLTDEPQNIYEQTKSLTAMKEIAAQFEKGTRYGITFDHLNCHGGRIYEEDQIESLPVCLHFCATHKLPFRYPKNKDVLCDMTTQPLTKRVEVAQFELKHFTNRKKVFLPDQVISNLQPMHSIATYENLKAYYLDALRTLPDGITEMYFHPSKADSHQLTNNPEWQKRVWEYEFLMDADFIKMIENEDIQLVTWSEAFFKKS